MKIILGSKSPGRKAIFSEMGYEFIVMDPDIDEKSIRNENPEKLVIALAYAKAEALLPKIKEPSILITADQVVYCNDHIIEKPKDKDEAEKFLRLYMKYPAQTITAILITNTETKEQTHGVDIATIWLQEIPEDTIKLLTTQEHVSKCAGGFSLNDPLFYKHILKIEGTEESITGLPVELTKSLIQKSW